MSVITDLNGKYDAALTEGQKILGELKSFKGDENGRKSLQDSLAAKEKEMGDLNDQIQLEVKSINLEKQRVERNTATNLPGQGREGAEGAASNKSIGQLFIESDFYKNMGDPRSITDKQSRSMELKSFSDRGIRGMKTNPGPDITLGNVPQYPQLVDLYVSLPLFPPMLQDYLPKFTQNQNSYDYHQETEIDNNAATQTTERSALAQSGFKSKIVTITAAPVGTTFKVTETQIQDDNNIRGLLDGKAELFVNIEAERQLLKGTGTGEMTGIYNYPGIGTNNRGSDLINGGNQNNVDAISYSIKNVRVNGVANPGLVIIHPDNMQSIRLLKDDMGRYIYGEPSQAAPQRLWGLPILETPHAISGTALVADLRAYTRLGIRMGMMISLERSGTDFEELSFTLRAWERMSFEVTRPLAICNAGNLN